MTQPIRLLTAVGLVLAVAACSGPSDDGATTTVPSTVGPTSTTTGAAPPTTATPTTSRADTNVLAEGSGCTPGDGDLPDGRWFGYVAAADPESIDFDLACMFSGDAAIVAAAEDGEESPPPNNYYVRNLNDQLRTIPVADSTEVVWFPNVGDPTSSRTDPYAVWRVEGGEETEGRIGPFPLGVWLDVEDGDIVHVEEFWVP